MAETVQYIIAAVLFLAGSGVFYYGFNRMRKRRLIQDTPRSKIRSMAMGLVEIHGTVLADKHIKTPFSQSDCVYYRYEIKEYRRHTSRDSQGRTHTTYSWDTVATGEQRIPFFAKDETGSAYVAPNGAEFNVPVKKVFLQRAGLFGAIGTIVSALKNWDNRKVRAMDVSRWGLTPIDPKSHLTFGVGVGDRKYYEYYIEPNESLFVLGTAARAANGVLIRKGQNEPTFIISNRSEKELLGSLKWQMLGSFFLGAVLIIAGVLLLLYFLGVIGG